MLDALPLSGLGALDDGLAEESAHLLDSETTTKGGAEPRHITQPEDKPFHLLRGNRCATRSSYRRVKSSQLIPMPPWSTEELGSVTKLRLNPSLIIPLPPCPSLSRLLGMRIEGLYNTWRMLRV